MRARRSFRTTPASTRKCRHARNVIGGDGRSVFDGQTLMPDIDRNILYTHFDYDINPSLQFHDGLLVGQGRYGELPGRARRTSRLCIRPDNAYLSLLDAASQALVTGAAKSRAVGGAVAVYRALVRARAHDVPVGARAASRHHQGLQHAAKSAHHDRGRGLARGRSACPATSATAKRGPGTRTTRSATRRATRSAATTARSIAS